MGAKIALRYRDTLQLYPTAPFCFDGTVFKPDHFSNRDHDWTSGRRRQTMLWRGNPLGLVIRNEGTVELPRVEVDVWSRRPVRSACLQGVARELEYRLNLDLDLTEFNRRFRKDPFLSPCLRRLLGIRMLAVHYLWEDLFVRHRARPIEWLQELIRL